MSIIHNNTSSSEKVNLLHQNPATYLFRAVLSCKCCLICADFSPDSYQTTFSLDEALLLIMDSILLIRSFWFHEMLTDGLEWCGLLWCFYQLFGLSFWRHPFTAEDPLLRQWCNATFLQIWQRNKLVLVGLRVRAFSAYLNVFGELFL